jgi:hypothetical protein
MQCRYAWVQHTAIARTVGVTQGQIAALERREIPLDVFNVPERVTFAFADEVVDAARVKDATFAAVPRLFSTREVLELLLLIGYFRTICGVMTTLAVAEEPPFGGKVLKLVSKTGRRQACPRPETAAQAWRPSMIRFRLPLRISRQKE